MPFLSQRPHMQRISCWRSFSLLTMWKCGLQKHQRANWLWGLAWPWYPSSVWYSPMFHTHCLKKVYTCRIQNRIVLQWPNTLTVVLNKQFNNTVFCKSLLLYVQPWALSAFCKLRNILQRYRRSSLAAVTLCSSSLNHFLILPLVMKQILYKDEESICFSYEL